MSTAAFRNGFRVVLVVLAVIAATFASGAASAQDVPIPLPPASVEAPPSSQDPSLAQSLQALQRRLDDLERQNRELQNTVRSLQPVLPATGEVVPAGAVGSQPVGPATAKPSDDVRNVVKDVLKEEAKAKTDSEAAAKKKAEDEGVVVGTSLGMTAKWDKHVLWFENPEKSFKFHLGGRLQYDIIGVSANDLVQFGNGGMGRYDDGTNFRRARLTAEGTFWEVFNFDLEVDFVNATNVVNAINTTVTKNAAGEVTNVVVTPVAGPINTPVPTEFWLEMAQIPLIGNIRVGNQKPPIGFEHYTSSRFLNFLERSNMFDSFIEDGDNGFTNGIMAYNWTESQRATGAIGMFKTTRNIFGSQIGDGEWGVTGRLTWLPYYEENGRYLVHLGLGTQYRGLDDNQLRLRSRTELRNGNAVLHNTVAIAQLEAQEGQLLIQPEFVFQIGPFLWQSEFAYSRLDGVNKIIKTPTQTNVNLANRPAYQSTGAYIEVLYFLTGEHRDYNKKLPGFGRVVPYENVFFVDADDGGWAFSKGAWQVGARYSWLNQNDDLILGGEIHSWTLGLNWFMTPNCKIQWNYEYAFRDVGTQAPGAANGIYHGAGVRFAYDF